MEQGESQQFMVLVKYYMSSSSGGLSSLLSLDLIRDQGWVKDTDDYLCNWIKCSSAQNGSSQSPTGRCITWPWMAAISCSWAALDQLALAIFFWPKVKTDFETLDDI